ncbi:hypothetical protein V8F20_009806 [Naviculisporaceae sp. PSN 640]
MAFLGDDSNTTVAQKGMRLPKVREKLSNLVRRKGSTRSKLQLTATTTSPRPSADGVILTTTKTGVPILDVDVTRTRSYRLAEGWLEQEEAKKSPSSPNKKQHGQVGGEREREPEAEEDLRRHSKTPIAAMFSKSTDQLAGALESISFRKPVHSASVSTTVLPAASRVGATGGVPASTRAVKTTKQEVAPPAPAPEPQPIRISLQHSLVEEPVAITPPVTQSRGRTVGPSWGIRAVPADLSDEAQRHPIRHVGLLRSVGDNTTGLRVSGGGNGNGNGGGNGGGGAVGDSAKRFSAPSVSSPVPVPEPIMKTVLSTVPRSSSLNMPTSPSTSSLNPDNQRRSWQPAPTSTRTSQDGTSMPPPPRRTLSSRPPSVAITSSRLSWIRDLENKSSSPLSSSSSTSDMQRLKKSGGGVAGKLAMFEQIQKQTQPALPPTISRSNSRASSRSRMSSAAFTDHSGSVFSAPGGAHLADESRGRPLSFVSTATGRTSMDSTRDSLPVSHRNSGVMAYYGEDFRERMEGVAGGWAKQLQKLTGGGKEKEKEKEEGEKQKEEEMKTESPVTDSESRTDATAVKSGEGESQGEWKAPVALPFLADVRAAGDKEQAVQAKEETVKDEKPTEEEEQPTEQVETLIKEEEQPAKKEEDPITKEEEEEKPTKEEEQFSNEELDPLPTEQPAQEVEPVKEPVAEDEVLVKDEGSAKDIEEPGKVEEPAEDGEEVVKVEAEPVKDEQKPVKEAEVVKQEEELVTISAAVAVEEPRE